MEDIISHLVGGDKGIASSVGGQPITMDQAVDVWNAICAICEETLLKGQTLVVPGLANVGVKKEVEHMGGIWKPKTSLVPHVTLSPAFVSQYCPSRFTHATTDVKHGKTNPVLLNPSTVSCYAGVSRHQCQSLLKDAVRSIGQTILAEGKSRTILVEMGFCTLEFASEFSSKGGFQVRWNKDFLAEFNDAMCDAAQQLQRSADRVMGTPSHYVRPSSARSASSGGSNSRSPRCQRAVPSSHADKAHAFAAANPPISPRVPRPPSTQSFRPKAGLGITGASAAQTASFDANRRASTGTPPLPFEGELSQPQNHEGTETPPRKGGAPQTKFSSHPEQLRAYAQTIHRAAQRPSTTVAVGDNCASPRGGSWDATLNSIARSTMAPYTKQKARKAIYRRIRGQAFEDSWDSQLQFKRQREAEEREVERKRLELFKKAMSEQAAKEHNEKLQQRNEEREVAALNAAMVGPRRAMQLPRVESAGDLFSTRKPPSPPPSRTKEILELQLAEQKRRREQEREDDRAYQRNLVQQDARFNDAQREAKIRRREEANHLKQEYDRQILIKKQEEERFKATMPKSGCILYSEEESATDEAKEITAMKMRTRQFQQENKRLVEDRQAREAKDAAERHFINAERRRKEREVESARQLEERKQLCATQANMRAEWTAQMQQRKAQASQEKYERTHWRDHTYLRNESSDDENEDLY